MCFYLLVCLDYFPLQDLSKVQYLSSTTKRPSMLSSPCRKAVRTLIETHSRDQIPHEAMLATSHTRDTAVQNVTRMVKGVRTWRQKK